ncbi:hypothetical protein [Cryobacterium flavum]|uniref:hypothetical protein n=2 Tax=Cryobacterium flavum TaxID=1424659 RepID=UPI001F5416EE|nr:hypothetical protein [Cryobacterium flavum]
MGAVLVTDQMHGQLDRDVGVDRVQELLELDRAVPDVNVEGGEEAGRAVTHVVMGAFSGMPAS